MKPGQLLTFSIHVGVGFNQGEAGCNTCYRATHLSRMPTKVHDLDFRRERWPLVSMFQPMSSGIPTLGLEDVSSQGWWALDAKHQIYYDLLTKVANLYSYAAPKTRADDRCPVEIDSVRPVVVPMLRQIPGLFLDHCYWFSQLVPVGNCRRPLSIHCQQ